MIYLRKHGLKNTVVTTSENLLMSFFTTNYTAHTEIPLNTIPSKDISR